MASPIAATGVGSGLDVSGLVSKLMDAESIPLTTLNNKESAVTIQVSALGTLRGGLSAFQSTLTGLEQSAAYTANRVSVGDATVASATSDPGGDTGSHTLEVTNLAQAQRLKSDTFSSLTTAVGTGTLTIEYGAYDATGNTFSVNAKQASQTITIDAAHSSLTGVRDAINAQSGGGVSASIVNDGTGNRLVLASKNTGTQYGVRISAADDDGNATDATGLSKLAYDPTATAGAGKNLTQVVVPEDAQFQLDGIAITKSSNTVTDALAGTTINLLKTNTGAPTTLSVNQDTSGVKSAIDTFIKGYNDLNSSINTLTAYDPSTKVAATLQGDQAVRSLADKLHDGLSAVVAGVQGGYHALSQVGITFDRNGVLSVDSTKLNAALKADPHAVESLFATVGSGDDPLVTYATATAKTPVGKYDLNVTQLATQGSVVGSTAAGLTIDASNDQLSVTVNGVASSVTLGHRTYANSAALAAEIQTQVNGSADLSGAGVTVAVSDNAGVLTMTSNKYGSASLVSLSGGTAQDNLFGTGPTATAGLDVAGTIAGQPAVGSGQTLTATNGLAVNINGGSLGARGNVYFTRGVAVQLDSMISSALGTTGVLTSRTNALNAQIKQIDKDKDDLTTKLAAEKAQYTTQFNTLDGLITSMQSTMTYLAQQLSALNSSK
jgi:flagellar hook-associated protein 2